MTKWKQKREQGIEENGKRGCGGWAVNLWAFRPSFVVDREYSHRPFSLSRWGLLIYPQRIHRRGRPFDFWGGYGWLMVSVRNFFPKPLVWVWGMFKWLAGRTYVFYQRNIFRFRNMALILSLRRRENLWLRSNNFKDLNRWGIKPRLSFFSAEKGNLNSSDSKIGWKEESEKLSPLQNFKFLASKIFGKIIVKFW